MSAASRLRWFAAAAGLVLCVACGSKKKDAPPDDETSRTHASGSASASGDGSKEARGQKRYPSGEVVDLDYRFRIEPPSKQHRAMTFEDSSVYEATAIAGLVAPADVILTVHASELEQGDLGAIAMGMYVDFRARGGAVDELKDVTFQGLPAKRFGVVNALRRSCYLYVRRQKFVFALAVGAPVSNPLASSCDVLAPLFDAVKLDDGPIVGPRYDEDAPDVATPSYRLHDGLYESAVGGYRLSIPRGVRTLVGLNAARMLPGYDVLVQTGQPECALGVRHQMVFMSSGREAFIEETRQTTARSMGATILPETLTWSVAGKKAKISRMLTPLREYFFGIVEQDHRTLELLGWCPPSTSDKPGATIERIAEKLAWLDDDAASSLRSELASVEPIDNVAEGDLAFRHGRLDDYAFGLSWTAPKRGWEVFIGTSAGSWAGGQPRAVYRATSLELGVSTLVFGQRGIIDKPGEYHDYVVSGLGTFKLGNATPTKIGTVPAITSTGEVDAYHYRVTTAAVGGAALAIITSGLASTFRDKEKAALEAETGLGVATLLVPFKTETNRYVDNHLGFSVELPTPWVMGNEMVDLHQRRVLAQDGDRVIEVHATVDAASARSNVLIAGATAQRLALRGLSLPTDDPAVTEQKVGSFTGRRLSWKPEGGEPIDAVVVEVDRITYVLIARGKGALEAALNGTKLVP
ncbi:MAG: hypothetical protein HOW73_03225 [Polyangiaceae bacterium]|nr:hypothetical protein [Polyangiaceae bacterium]